MNDDIPVIVRDEIAGSLRSNGRQVTILDRYAEQNSLGNGLYSVPVLHYDVGECRVIVRFGDLYAEVSVLSEQNCSGVGAAEYADPQFLEKLSAVLDSCHGRTETAK